MDSPVDRSRHQQIAAALTLFFPLLCLGLGVLLPFVQLGVAFTRVIGSGWAEHLHYSYLLMIVRFTLWQASVSTLVTVIAAFVLALICARNRFRGKILLLSLGQIPFFLPSIVVSLAFIQVYGQHGFINRLLGVLGVEEPLAFLYNPWAIIAAHVFFNLSFLARSLVVAWAGIPEEQRYWGRVLGLSAWQRFRLVDWVYLRRPLLNGALLVFVLCLNSFAIVMVLGGGIRSTTAEVGIYQFLHGEFDLPQALVLAVVQLLLTLLASCFYSLASFSARPNASPLAAVGGREENLPLLAKDPQGIALRILLLIYGLFLYLPLLALLMDGLASCFSSSFSLGALGELLWPSLLNSLLISGLSSLCSCLLGLSTAVGIFHLGQCVPRLSVLVDRAIYLLMGISPVALSLGYYLFWRDLLDLQQWALAIIISIHSIAAIPLVLKTLLPVVLQLKARNRCFELTLGISYWQGFLHIELPQLLPIFMVALSSSFALSLGGIAIVAMFSQAGVETIPLTIYGLMGVYRYEEAAVICLALIVVLVLMGIGQERIFKRQLAPKYR